MKIFFNIVILTICLVLSGCTPEDQATTISFDNRISFLEFPVVVSLDSGTIIDTKTIGNLQFRVIDSLMVIATAERENSWKVRSIPGDSTLLEFISIDSGPDEFVSSPLISQASFLMVMEIYTYFCLIIIGSNFERLIFQSQLIQVKWNQM